MDIANCSPTALAAIEMCESLIITLVNKGVLTADDAVEMLDVVTSSKRVEAEEEGSPVHRKAGEIIELIKTSVASAESPSQREASSVAQHALSHASLTSD